MMTRPTFSGSRWLGNTISLIALAAVAVFFRFYQLSALPPSLSGPEAGIGLSAWRLLEHGQIPGFTLATGLSPLWVLIVAPFVKLMGGTALALRLPAMLLGVLAVGTTYLWAKTWFGVRAGWLTAFLVAVTPWSVTLSRNGLPAVLWPLLVTLFWWAATWAHHRGRLGWWLLTGLSAVLLLLAGPFGWLTLAVTAVLAVGKRGRSFLAWRPSRGSLVALAVSLLGLAATIWLVVTSWSTWSHLGSAAGLARSLPAVSEAAIKTILMFNIHGDESYRHNLGGEPLLNAFVGIMLVAGLLVAIARSHERRYRVTLVLLIVLLIPAFISRDGAPDAARASAVLPVVMLLAALGIGYMLDLWYATFPINSAARTTGQAAIVVLLALTIYQGYTQYFVAWAGSSETQLAYNESANGAATFIANDHASGRRYVVAAPDEIDVISYLDHQRRGYDFISPADITALPVSSGASQFIITPTQRDAAVANLKLKLPGGVLRPHYSLFNQVESYYVYEIAK